MKSFSMLLLTGILAFTLHTVRAQSLDSSSYYNYGIWQGFGDALNKYKYPEIRGRLCNFNWKDLEISSNVWIWDAFDSELQVRTADSLPVIFMVYTEEDAPDWLYDAGVPEVIERDDNDNVIATTPFYADAKYKYYFKRMITKVHQHVETLADSVRRWIIGVQGCYGSTGDYIGYKGNVDPQYQLTGTDFYNLFIEFSQYYYDEYQGTDPKIYLLSNPQNNGEDQMNWLIQNCPRSWIKTGSLGKGFELNDEADKATWLYDLLNKPQNGEYLRARSELQGDVSDSTAGWWKEYPYRNMFALMTYCIYWGVDWSNQSPTQIIDTAYDEAFQFYNKYSGLKDPSTSPYAMCALKDGLDASDTKRFPISLYGNADRTDTTRYRNIVNAFASHGALLEDPTTATLEESDNLLAKGINDVGWNIIVGNYDRYLHQINANQTSVGYWNVNTSADPNSMYGKYARGFDVSHGKIALYFDVDSTFLNNAPLNGNYPVSIDITYLDTGYGSCRLFYDAKDGQTSKPSLQIVCTNSGLWKKASVTLPDAYFGNRSILKSDFYIKSTNNQNMIFSIVELSRPNADKSNVGLFATSLSSFDTVCLKSTSNAKAFILSGAFLSGEKIIVGPFKGYIFSLTDTTYSDSVVISQYGTTINKTIYIKFNPQKTGSYNGNVSIRGGGVASINLFVSGMSVNTHPTLFANISNVTCFNAKNGAINLTLSGGRGPFYFNWVDSSARFTSSNQDINNLTPSYYTVTVISNGGCTVNSGYPIIQPDKLAMTVTVDSAIICKNASTTVTVTGTGGTLPYNGTGVFPVNAGNTTFKVTDANNCSASDKITLSNGTLVAPARPAEIKSPRADALGLCNGGNFYFYVDTVSTATSYAWSTPDGCAIVSGLNTYGITMDAPSGFATGNLYVSAVNRCGSSTSIKKQVTGVPGNPGSITGPQSVSIGQINLLYKVSPAIPGLTYNWTVPNGTIITSGQGTYKILVTWGLVAGRINVKAKNNCGESGPATLDVSLLSSISSSGNINSAKVVSSQQQNKIRISPNPAVDFCSLSFQTTIPGKQAFIITDITGKILLKKNFVSMQGENKESIDVHNYSKGTYLISLVDELGNIRVAKLIKE